MKLQTATNMVQFLYIFTLLTESYTKEDEFLDKFPDLKAILIEKDENGVEVDRSPLLIAPNYPEQLIKGTNTTPTIDNPVPKREMIPAITYEIIYATPGNQGGTKDFHGSPRVIQPRCMEEVKTASGERVYEIWRQPIDGQIAFSIWSPSAYMADDLLMWFMDYMWNVAAFVRPLGVSDLTFKQISKDERAFLLASQLSLNVRTIQYYIRTDHLYIGQQKTVEKFELYVNNLLSTTII